MEYLGYAIEVIRSKRKTMALQVTRDGRILLRAPRLATEAELRRFVREKQDWIARAVERAGAAREAAAADPLSEEDLRGLAKEAKEHIPGRVRYYASLMRVEVGTVTVRCQKTRWGSCSAKGNLNFNCLLMLAPRDVLDSVIVHELAHRREMNHGRRFYDLLYRYMPDYDRRNEWLKKNGPALLARAAAAKEG